jgi:cytochrome c
MVHSAQSQHQRMGSQGRSSQRQRRRDQNRKPYVNQLAPGACEPCARARTLPVVRPALGDLWRVAVKMKSVHAFQTKEKFMRSIALSAALLLAGLTHAQAQDAAAGEKVFTQCKACHQIGESAKNAVGPVLNGLFGRHSGSVEGYNYSPANKNSGLTWDEATFREYIKDPRAKVPGTKMIYAGLKDDQKVNDLVAYLKQFDASGKKGTQ